MDLASAVSPHNPPIPFWQRGWGDGRNVSVSFPSKEKWKECIGKLIWKIRVSTLVWFVSPSLYISLYISCMCMFYVCVVMKMRQGNDIGNTARPTPGLKDRKWSLWKQEAGSVSAVDCEKALLPAIPPFHWVSFRFVLIMVEKNAATRRGQIKFEREKNKPTDTIVYPWSVCETL